MFKCKPVYQTVHRAPQALIEDHVSRFRFPSSDRVTLQGLMGAYGPTGNIWQLLLLYNVSL